MEKGKYTEKIKYETLPRSWNQILSRLESGDVRIFPMEGQALNNARHAISRMRGKLILRTKAKGDVFFVFCIEHIKDCGDKVKIARSELQQILRYIALYPDHKRKQPCGR